MIEGFDQENSDFYLPVIISSPFRLAVGGRSKFARLARVYHVAISGNTICNSLAMIIA